MPTGQMKLFYMTRTTAHVAGKYTKVIVEYISWKGELMK